MDDTDLEDAQYYEQYYLTQAGNGLAHYSGRMYMPTPPIPRQRGEGIGNFLRTAGSMLKPLVIAGAKTAGRELLSSGKALVGDVLTGQSFKNAAKARLKDAGKNILRDFADSASAATTTRKRRRTTFKAKPRHSGAKRRKTSRSKHRSIFQ